MTKVKLMIYGILNRKTLVDIKECKRGEQKIKKIHSTKNYTFQDANF